MCTSVPRLPRRVNLGMRLRSLVKTTYLLAHAFIMVARGFGVLTSCHEAPKTCPRSHSPRAKFISPAMTISSYTGATVAMVSKSWMERSNSCALRPRVGK